MRCRTCRPLPDEVARAADLLGRRWALAILWAAAEAGAVLFNEFKQTLEGIPPRTLAAHAAGLTDVIIPERNRADLDDVPEDVREAMRFHPVMTLGEVLELALEPKAKPSLHAV